MRRRRHLRLTGKTTPWATIPADHIPAPTTEQDPALARPDDPILQPGMSHEWSDDCQAQDTELQDFFSYDDFQGSSIKEDTSRGRTTGGTNDSDALVLPTAVMLAEAFEGKSSRGADGAAVGES